MVYDWQEVEDVEEYRATAVKRLRRSTARLFDWHSAQLDNPDISLETLLFHCSRVLELRELYKNLWLI